ncbi:MAG: glycosyltransferase family 9 protein [Candidatus Paceibacterota bacterium]|jgi:ADP-heptose:LPS heptosyltransferase
MSKVIRFLERMNAQLLCLRSKIQPKNLANNPMLIFADLGLGDLLMFLPTIKAIYERGAWDTIYFRTERAEAIEVLKGIFPRARFITPYENKNGNARFIGYERALLQYKFGIAVVNFHQAYKSNILPMVKLRIPITIGHSWPENKYHSIWTDPVEYNKEYYQVAENLKLLIPLGLYEKHKESKMFFHTQPFKIPYEKYVLIQPASSTVREKNCWDVEAYVRNINGPIIFTGNAEEARIATNIMCNNPHSTIFNYCGKLNIFQTAYLIKKSSQFLCNEGGLAHLASALNVRADVFVNTKIKREQIYHKNLNYIFV